MTRFWGWLTRARDPIDDLIKPPVYTHRGQDDSLRVRSNARRQAADTIRKEAKALDTKDDRRSRIHLAR